MPIPQTQLAALYDAHAAGLYQYLVTFTKAEADARDLLQELFIKLAAARTLELQNEKAFLYRLGHNLAIDWLRRRGVRLESETRLREQIGEEPQPAADPDLALFEQSCLGAMKALPEEQRTIVQLKLREGWTFEQIAEIQRIPLNTAASRYRYAIEKLRSVLRPIYEELQ